MINYWKGRCEMAQNKKKFKWTVVDTLIVIAVIGAGFAGFKFFGGKLTHGTKTTIEAQILIANQPAQLGTAIEAGKGEDVTLSLTEKDSGVLKDAKIVPAEVVVYDSINGEYKIQHSETNVDIYATVNIAVEENDYAFLAGTTQIKVGSAIPFRGKGYASEGNVITISKEVGSND